MEAAEAAATSDVAKDEPVQPQVQLRCGVVCPTGLAVSLALMQRGRASLANGWLPHSNSLLRLLSTHLIAS